MATTARERLAELLVGESGATGSFSAELLAPPQLLRLAVAGLGLVDLPVRAPLAKKLVAVARPAKFGRSISTARSSPAPTSARCA